MPPPTNIIDQLKRDEGTSLMLYRDTAGKWTIGFGRNLSDDGISLEEANVLLANDVRKADDLLRAAFGWYKDLDSVRQGILQNMCFNLGMAGLLEFRNMLGAMAAKAWSQAAAEMLDSKWAAQVGSRAQRLAQQMISGVWV